MGRSDHCHILNVVAITTLKWLSHSRGRNKLDRKLVGLRPDKNHVILILSHQSIINMRKDGGYSKENECLQAFKLRKPA